MKRLLCVLLCAAAFGLNTVQVWGFPCVESKMSEPSACCCAAAVPDVGSDGCHSNIRDMDRDRCSCNLSDSPSGELYRAFVVPQNPKLQKAKYSSENFTSFGIPFSLLGRHVESTWRKSQLGESMKSSFHADPFYIIYCTYLI